MQTIVVLIKDINSTNNNIDRKGGKIEKYNFYLKK